MKYLGAPGVAGVVVGEPERGEHEMKPIKKRKEQQISLLHTVIRTLFILILYCDNNKYINNLWLVSR